MNCWLAAAVSSVFPVIYRKFDNTKQALDRVLLDLPSLLIKTKRWRDHPEKLWESKPPIRE
jgi:hypothetical protein